MTIRAIPQFGTRGLELDSFWSELEPFRPEPKAEAEPVPEPDWEEREALDPDASEADLADWVDEAEEAEASDELVMAAS